MVDDTLITVTSDENEVRPVAADLDDTTLARRRRWMPFVLAATGLPVLGVGLLSVWTVTGGHDKASRAEKVTADGDVATADAFDPAETLPTDTIAIDPSSALEINAARPFDAKPDLPAAFRFGAGAEDRARAIDCLSAAVLYEAGGDTVGQRAVAQVVLNRVRHPAYPKTVCAVVFEGSDRTTGCQFTFTCDGALRRRPSAAQWSAAQAVARKAIAGEIDKEVGTATHYHADYVLPRWSGNLQKIARVGPHIFYRWPGSFGSRGAFRDQGTRVEPQIRQLAYFGNHGDADMLAEGDDAELALADEAVVPAVQGVGLAAANPGRIVMQLDMKSPSGRWAMQALDNCDGKAECVVVGYASGTPQKSRPAFFYMREGDSGLDRALWDCRRVNRPSDDQCLPDDAAALAHLMRDRTGES